MASDRQNQAWMAAQAATYMAQNDLQEVDSSVVAHIMDEFIPNPDVPNELIADTIKSLDEKVAEVKGEPIYVEMTATATGTSKVN